MIKYEVASDGTPLDVDSLPKTYTYDGNGQISTITVTVNGAGYVKTFTWSAGSLSTSNWVKQ